MVKKKEVSGDSFIQRGIEKGLERVQMRYPEIEHPEKYLDMKKIQRVVSSLQEGVDDERWSDKRKADYVENNLAKYVASGEAFKESYHGLRVHAEADKHARRISRYGQLTASASTLREEGLIDEREYRGMLEKIAERVEKSSKHIGRVYERAYQRKVAVTIGIIGAIIVLASGIGITGSVIGESTGVNALGIWLGAAILGIAVLLGNLRR